MAKRTKRSRARAAVPYAAAGLGALGGAGLGLYGPPRLSWFQPRAQEESGLIQVARAAAEEGGKLKSVLERIKNAHPGIRWGVPGALLGAGGVLAYNKLRKESEYLNPIMSKYAAANAEQSVRFYKKWLEALQKQWEQLNTLGRVGVPALALGGGAAGYFGGRALAKESEDAVATALGYHVLSKYAEQTLEKVAEENFEAGYLAALAELGLIR